MIRNRRRIYSCAQASSNIGIETEIVMTVVMYTATREGAMAQVLDLDLLDHIPLHRILVAS
jgi:hypothetical protein